jgi:short chain dehydrogenase
MAPRTWLITGVSSGFGRQLTQQLLEPGDRVVGTVRDTSKVTDILERHPETFDAEVLDVTDTRAVRDIVDRAFARHGRIDVIVSNAGYGLFGAAEELVGHRGILRVGRPGGRPIRHRHDHHRAGRRPHRVPGMAAPSGRLTAGLPAECSRETLPGASSTSSPTG